jgi:hypothetical protein
VIEPTRTLLERHPLVRLNRVAQHLRLERMLAEQRKDWARARDCKSALNSIYGLKSIIVRLGVKKLDVKVE